MKKFYTWYQKHITGAIFIGLILGILTGLFLAGRFEPVLTVTSLLGSIYMNALNMMIFRHTSLQESIRCNRGSPFSLIANRVKPMITANTRT